ncbi:MAG: dihydroorotate dehydrogenase (quinone) [Rhodobacteraceae bacterium]|nr:dihydroorotate dehydrogenase (quinone) [Paracoccaceae bacterium]
MKLIERLGLAALHKFHPETSHGLSIAALKSGLAPLSGQVNTPRLATTIAGLDLPNPIGLAAGYDKNAEVIAPLTKAGFGFIEVGAATPRAQPGNPKPRLFRDRAADFALVLAHCGPYLDFATVNVSSPNTEKLRDLQGKDALGALLNGVLETNAGLSTPIPIFLKIAPDLTSDEIADIADVARETGISGIIATNTTLSREGLTSKDRGEQGGLSGAPLFEKSTRVLAQLSQLCGPDIPLIGVGGVSTAAQAYEKIRAGASAVQLYTALVYGGLSMVSDIAKGLDALLERDGFANVADAVGSGRADWL